MKYREYAVLIPDELKVRGEKVLEAMKKRDTRIPKDLGMTDFIAYFVYPNGVAFLEAAIKAEESNERVVKLPGEVPNPTARRLPPQIPVSQVYRGKRTPAR